MMNAPTPNEGGSETRPYLSQPDYLTRLQQAVLAQPCIHCGLCLQACPTYTLFGTEMDSPRGRISLIRAASEGRIDFAGAFQEHIQLCLACRACESACPSGVQYGSLLEMARIAMEEKRQPGLAERAVRWLVLCQLMPRLTRLKSIARLARLYQALGLSALARQMGLLPERLKNMEGLLPPMPRHYADYRQPAPAPEAQRGRVAFFYGCVQEAFLARVNQATIRVLQANGYAVHCPTTQTCCGAAQLHLGEAALARQLARQNIDAFLQADAAQGPFVAIINNAGGCGASLKEYAHLLKEDPLYTEKARRFSAQVKDISEFLVDHLNVIPRGEVKARVTYADSCHLRHAQKVVGPPRSLLQSVPGVELVELKQPDQCCGSAGVYNIVQADAANAILDKKMSDIAATGAEIIVTTNTGCHMQLQYGVRKAHLPMRVVHLVEILDQSYHQAP
jgi:glycolate dehydrogenase iron-sulfur subunit